MRIDLALEKAIKVYNETASHSFRKHYIPSKAASNTTVHSHHNFTRSVTLKVANHAELQDSVSLCPQNLNLTKLALLQMKWGSYRLSDAVHGYFLKASRFSPKKMEFSTFFKWYSKKFGSTLVTDYFTRTNSSNFNMSLFFHVLKPKFLNLSNDTAVVHLRLGDTTCVKCWHTRTNFGRSGRMYVYPKTYYEQIVRLLNITHVTKIVLTASTYYRAADASMKFSARLKALNKVYTLSMEYVKLVDDFFTKHGYQVFHRINCGIPDEDVIYMASSKYFIPGGGGFSKLLANMVKMNGGHVLSHQN